MMDHLKDMIPKEQTLKDIGLTKYFNVFRNQVGVIFVIWVLVTLSRNPYKTWESFVKLGSSSGAKPHASCLGRVKF